MRSQNAIIGAVTLLLLIGVTLFAVDANNRLKQLEGQISSEIQEPPADPEATPEDVLLQRADFSIGQSHLALERAQEALDLAFSLLGLFEALSLGVTVGGAVLVSVGLTRFNNAQNELTETRQLVESEIEGYRQRFDSEISAREKEMRVLRQELEVSAQQERTTTKNALLANALIPLGERQYRAADYQGAMNTYHRALELDPANPVVNQRLAHVYTQSGELEKAQNHYKKALESEKDFAPALAGLGFVSRRFAEQLTKSIDAEGLSEDEKVQHRIDRDQLLNRSEELLLKALKLSPKLIDDDGESWWGVLGGLYKRRGQIEQAIEAYYQATLVTPQSSYGLSNLALLYRKQNEQEKMIETYKRVERIASKEADAEQGNFWGYSDLIVSSYAIGKSQQAKDALPIAISIAPIHSPYMLEGLVESLRELTDVLDAEKVLPLQDAIRTIDAEIAKRASQSDS